MKELEIIYEDKDVLVIRKPAGVPVQSARVGAKMCIRDSGYCFFYFSKLSVNVNGKCEIYEENKGKYERRSG